MAKGDQFYFENFRETTALAHKAALYLVSCLENFEADKMPEMLREMHAIENSADVKKHEMREALAKAFVTPVDREDLDLLSHRLDDVTDLLEEILQEFYIYDIKTIDPAAVTFAQNLVRSCELMGEILGEFENFKRSKTIHSLIIKANDIEEECDKLYLSSMRELTLSGTDPLSVLSWRQIYESFEACADACEHVSECVSSVIMKNT